MSRLGRVRVRAFRALHRASGTPDLEVRVRARVLCERVNRTAHHAALTAGRYCPTCSAALR